MKSGKVDNRLEFPLISDPFFKYLLTDRSIKVVNRAIDANWKYNNVVPLSVAGFNPFESIRLIPVKSKLMEWRKCNYLNFRKFNESDLLLKEVLFAAHDALHIWAYKAVHALSPKLNFGSQPITKKNFEDYVFCHLLTEAVATVGLDYWYLSTFDLEEKINVGTKLSSLTVSYHEKHLAEFRRFNSDFKAQVPKFFNLIVNFYCSGDFPNFTIHHLIKSPVLLGWLRHEIKYGAKQREYARAWFGYLCRDKIELSTEQLQRPVGSTAPWKKKMIDEISLLLWDMVKNNKIEAFPKFDCSALWSSNNKNDQDFRFTNIVGLRDESFCAEEILNGKNVDLNFRHFFYQYISTYNYESFDKELIKLFPFFLEKRDFGMISHLLKNQKRLPRNNTEPENLFILN